MFVGALATRGSLTILPRWFWLREGVLAGRSGPDQDPWDLQSLVDANIGAVLSVNDGHGVDGRALHAAGIAYARVSLSRAAPPRRGDAKQCLRALPRILDFIDRQTSSGHAVLVHCRAGKDRTGLALAAYLCAREGYSPEAATAELRRVRPIAFTAPGWLHFAHQVLRRL